MDERAPARDLDALKAHAYMGEGTVTAGDRAPDAPGLVKIGGDANPTSLFNIFGATYHTVLLFSADANTLKDQLAALAEYPSQTIRSVVIVPQGADGSESSTTEFGDVGLTVEDRDGHAYVGYNVNIAKDVSTTVIVRPDGVVGGIVLGLAGLQRYFKGVFV